MSNTLQIFHFNSIAVRVEIDEHGNPWFCAKDVCDILGYVNSRKAVSDHCNTSGVTNRYVTSSSCVENGDVTSRARETQSMTFINEGNLYRLVIKSNKPEAEPFEAWVCDEVLPSIRKHGYYALPKSSSVTFDEMPEELPPFQRVKPSLLIKLGKMSKSLAQAYLIECGVTPDYVQQQLGRLGDAAPTLGIDNTEAPTVLVARFVDDWQAQLIAAPFTPCLGSQALRLFYAWAANKGVSVRQGENLLMSALYRHPGFYNKRNRIQIGRHSQLKSLLMIDGHKPPVNMPYADWLATCVAEMEVALTGLEAS